MRVLRGQRYSRTSGRGCQRIVDRGRTRSVLKERGPGLWPRAPLFCLAGQGGGPQGRPPGRQTPPPPACPPLPSCAHIQPPYGWRRRAGEGEGGDVGSRRGAAAFCGPRGPAKPKHGRGPKVPAHALCALCAPAAPPGRWDLPPAKRSIRQPFPLRLPTNKTSPPLPMSGGPA